MFFPLDIATLPTEDFSSQVVQVETTASQRELEFVQASTDQTYSSISNIAQLYSEDRFVPVTHIKDVEPNDWAYEALRNLVEKYQCFYEQDGLFNGDQAISRYEFAVFLDACLTAIYEQFDQDTSLASDEELTSTVSQLAAEFSTELATLSERTDTLATSIETLESNRFAKYTKLKGEAIFSLAKAYGDNFVQRSADLSFLPGVSIDLDEALVNQFNMMNATIPEVRASVDNEQYAVFGYRVRLDLDTSFTGEDSLLIRLSGTNLRPFTANSRGRFRAPAIPGFLPRPINQRFVGNTGEAFQTLNINESKLIYSFPVGTARLSIAAAGAAWHDFAPTVNPYFFDEDGGLGAISTLASHNPIYRIGGGTGLVLNVPLAWRKRADKSLDLTLGYLAGVEVSNPLEGFANASYGSLIQTTFDMGAVDWAFTYVHAYNRENDALFNHGFNNRDGFVGTQFANLPGSTLQRLTRPLVGLSTTGVVSNSYGFGASWEISDKVSLSDFASYTDLKILDQGDGDLWTYGVGLALPDFGKENNLLGFFFGAQPYISSLDLPSIRYENESTPLHFEAFYRHNLGNRISITPGIVWLMAPNGLEPDVVVTSLRTTFSF